MAFEKICWMWLRFPPFPTDHKSRPLTAREGSEMAVGDLSARHPRNQRPAAFDEACLCCAEGIYGTLIIGQMQPNKCSPTLTKHLLAIGRVFLLQGGSLKAGGPPINNKLPKKTHACNGLPVIPFGVGRAWLLAIQLPRSRLAFALGTAVLPASDASPLLKHGIRAIPLTAASLFSAVQLESLWCNSFATRRFGPKAAQAMHATGGKSERCQAGRMFD